MNSSPSFPNRRQFLTSLGVTAATLAASRFALEADDAPAFQTVANKKYSHIRGFNYQPSNGSTGYEIWRNFDLALIDRELSLGKKYFPAMNAIRFWLSWDAFVREPKVFAKNFDAALGVAAKYQLQVLPVLFNRWHDAELDWGGIYIDQFLPGGSYGQKPKMFDAYLEAIVGGHADDSRIFAWDLCNEPFLYSDSHSTIPGSPEVVQAELKWLGDIYAICKRVGAKAPLAIGAHQGTDMSLINPYCDIFTMHDYWDLSWSRPDFQSSLDKFVTFANKVGKPIIISETCWGSTDDAKRVQIIRGTLEELQKRDLGFLAYLLHHSLIADAHRAEFGPVGAPGNLSFIEADGSLRPGHEVWNEFAK